MNSPKPLKEIERGHHLRRSGRSTESKSQAPSDLYGHPPAKKTFFFCEPIQS